MPRTSRYIPEDAVVHVVNRGNDRRLLFTEPRDYVEFFGFLDHALARHPTRLLAYALMPNHWHLLVWSEGAAPLSHFLRSLTSQHAARIRIVSGTRGDGHVYQGRYRAKLVVGEVQYVRTVRYVEANALRARLVPRAEHWPWTSLCERLTAPRRIVDGPLALPGPERWLDFVNSATEEEGKSGPSQNGDSPRYNSPYAATAREHPGR